MRIAGYNVEFRKENDSWKIKIHVKSFNITQEKWTQIVTYVVNYLNAEGYITMDIPVRYKVLDILGKPIYINRFDQYGNDTQA